VGALLLMLPVLVLLVSASRRLAAQARPSPDPAPIFLLKTMLDFGETEKAERQMRDNIPVTKSRLEDLIAERDVRFDELGRFGATSGHHVHKAVLTQFMEENQSYSKLFEAYGRVANDPVLPKRFEARRLRYEGAFYTHAGEDACGDHLDWEEAQKNYRTALERLEAGFALAKELNETRIMASAKINIGSTLIRLLEPDNAIAAYKEGMRYADQLPGDMYKGMVRLNLGNTYVWIVDPQESLQYAQDALAAFKRMGRGTWESNALMVVGNAQLLQKQYASSWETMRSALDLAVQSGEDRVRGKALLNLGMLAMLLNRPDAASYIEQAMDWYANHGDVYTELERETVAQDGLMALSRAADLAGNRELAETYKKQFTNAINENPDRYSQMRSSPCFALYKAQPSNRQQSQRTQ
jgi:tetratricopeptide (TPR) repeat protein